MNAADVLSIASSIAFFVLTIVAIWLSIGFFKMSSQLAESTKQAAKGIGASLARLEKLCDKLYADTFSMMRDTVSDMRRHIWPEETMMDVKRFDFDVFSTNPTIVDKGNRLRVMTSDWRALVSLISGYRCLEVDPSSSDMVLYRRSAWLFTCVARLPFNEIRYIKPSKMTYQATYLSWSTYVPSTVYTTLWRVQLVLEDQGGMLPLFQWEMGLGSFPGVTGPVPSRSIDYEAAAKSTQERDFNRLVSRLCELTGKPWSWG